MKPADEGTERHRELYWRFYLRLQEGWTGGGGDKLSRVTAFASRDSWAQAMAVHVWSGNSATPDGEFVMLDPARGTDVSGKLTTAAYNDFAGFTWLGSSRGVRPIFADSSAGAWRCIEARVSLNDPGYSNGSASLWVDGRLEAQRLGLNLVGRFNEYGLNVVYLENFWDTGSPALQERYFDHFVVSTRRIGCLAS